MGSAQFQIVPCSSLYFFSRSIGPLKVVNANYRVFICCTCPFQSVSLLFVYFGFLRLQVSPVSNLRPDTSRRRWSLTEAHLFSCAVGRGEQLQINVTGVCGECSQCIDCTGFAPTLGACAFPVYTAQAPGCAEGELSKAGPGLHAFSGLSSSSSGSWVLHKGADSAGHACCALPRSEELSWLGAWGPHCPRCVVHLIISPVPAAWFPGCTDCRVSPLGGWSQAAALLEDVNHPGSQKDLVSNWEPAYNLSLFLSSIVCPASFWREWAAFLGGCCPPPAFRSFVGVAQPSNDLLMNLWGRKWSPCPIPLPS